MKSCHPIGGSSKLGPRSCRPRKPKPLSGSERAVKLHELLGQSFRVLLSPHLEERLQVFGHLCNRGSWHVGEHVAFEVDDAPLPLHSRQLPEGRRLYPLVLVVDHRVYSLQVPIQEEPPEQEGEYAAPLSLPRRPPPPPEDLPEALLVHPHAPRQ